MKPSKRNHPPLTGVPTQQRQVEITQTSLHVGPLPSPEVLAQYEEVYPGIAERILQMAEREQSERHEQERMTISLERENQKSLNSNIIRGQILAFLSVIIISGLCGYFAYLGDIPTAGKTATWVIVSLAGVFITGRIVFIKNQK